MRIGVQGIERARDVLRRVGKRKGSVLLIDRRLIGQELRDGVDPGEGRDAACAGVPAPSVACAVIALLPSCDSKTLADQMPVVASATVEPICVVPS